VGDALPAFARRGDPATAGKLGSSRHNNREGVAPVGIQNHDSRSVGTVFVPRCLFAIGSQVASNAKQKQTTASFALFCAGGLVANPAQTIKYEFPA
jgi:hypothetical protein